MKLPGGDAAIVDRQKLTGYCLNPEHPRGKHKARVFETALGFTADVELLDGACEVEFSDDEGRTYAELSLPPDQLMVLHHRPQEAA